MSAGADLADACGLETTSATTNFSMVVTTERVVYAGLIGLPMQRTLGCVSVYVSMGAPFLIKTGGWGWKSVSVAVIPPYQPYDIVSHEKVVGSLHIEPESIDAETLQRLLTMNDDEGSAAALREALRAAVRGADKFNASTSDIDIAFFGKPLPGRAMDPRIWRTLKLMQQRPHDLTSAGDYARMAGLSPSRFLHLFTAELGTSFRGLRAWKRARSFLSLVREDLNLTEIALETGYPDSSHFSHSIRKVYGMRPKDILAGSRRLNIIRTPNIGSASA